MYTQELPCQQQPLTMAVHQAEGPQPQTLLTSSCGHHVRRVAQCSTAGGLHHHLPSPPITHGSTGSLGSWIPTPPCLFPSAELWGSCGALKAMLDIPDSLDAPPGPSSCSPDPTSALLLPCTPWQGSLAPGGSSPSSTGNVAELGASCKPKCCPAEAGSD